MLHKKMTMAAVIVAGAIFASLTAQAATVITNTGTANFDNESAVAQTAVTGSTVFTVAANPVLSVVKTRDIGKGQSGTVVTYQIRVSYPRVADVLLLCGDDSNAVNTTITDLIPAGMTYNIGTIRVSNDNGATWLVATDGSDGVEVISGYDIDFGITTAGTITAKLGTIIEGLGDVACAGVASTKVIEFKVTK